MASVILIIVEVNALKKNGGEGILFGFLTSVWKILEYNYNYYYYYTGQ